MTGTTRRWTGQTQNARRVQRRELLIVSAVTLYGSLGFHNTSVRAICREAGLTERYFYESFVNSEELLLAAFARVVAGIQERLRDADVPDETPDARVRRLLHAYYSKLQADPTEARVFLVEIQNVSDVVNATFLTAMFEVSKPIIDVYDVERRGPFSSNRLIWRGVAGGLLHIALAWIAEGYAQPISDVVDAGFRLCQLAIPAEGV